MLVVTFAAFARRVAPYQFSARELSGGIVEARFVYEDDVDAHNRASFLGAAPHAFAN